jgi:hypothetical protein
VLGESPLTCEMLFPKTHLVWSSIRRTSHSHPHAAACIAGYDVPRLGERAATFGAARTESGDERAGVRRDQFRRQLANARGERRDHGRARASMTLPTWRASRAPALGHETARTALPEGTG